MELFPLLFPLLFIVITALGSPACRDQDNNVVDWWAVYKIPELSENPNPSVAAGYGFFYLDANKSSRWINSTIDLSSEDQAVAYTLQQLYNSRTHTDVFHLMYNDETPSGSVSSYRGHTKGVLLFDFTAGYWLIHSVPKFPSSQSYAWPDTARKYGQSLLCISFPYAELQPIARPMLMSRFYDSGSVSPCVSGGGTQLLYYQPYIYASSLPSRMAQENTDLAKVIAGKTIYDPPWIKQYTFLSRGGVKFINFAKQRHFGKDIFYDFIAPSMDVSLYTETWQNGRGNFMSWCTGNYSVNNVDTVDLPDTITFSNSHDHSKWAIASAAEGSVEILPLVCIGGVNRQHGQLARGGGMMCMLDRNVWRVYNASVGNVEPCSTEMPQTEQNIEKQ